MKNIELALNRVDLDNKKEFIDIGSGTDYSVNDYFLMKSIIFYRKSWKGDGRLTLLGSEYFSKSHGIEINRWLVYYSKLKALRHGKYNSTNFFRDDLWKHDFSRSFYQDLPWNKHALGTELYASLELNRWCQILKLKFT